MELTIGVLKKIIHGLPDETILATLGIGNDKFDPFISLKRLLLLQDMRDGQQFLTINQMGSHFTQSGEQRHLIYLSQHWDEYTLKQTGDSVIMDEETRIVGGIPKLDTPILSDEDVKDLND